MFLHNIKNIFGTKKGKKKRKQKNNNKSFQAKNGVNGTSELLKRFV